MMTSGRRWEFPQQHFIPQQKKLPVYGQIACITLLATFLVAILKSYRLCLGYLLLIMTGVYSCMQKWCTVSFEQLTCQFCHAMIVCTNPPSNRLAWLWKRAALKKQICRSQTRTLLALWSQVAQIPCALSGKLSAHNWECLARASCTLRACELEWEAYKKRSVCVFKWCVLHRREWLSHKSHGLPLFNVTSCK